MTEPLAEIPKPAHSLLARSEIAVIALMLVICLCAWVVGLFSRGYDYDEVTRAHSVWLASQGLRPYNDFFECHPPYFALLTPLIRLAPDSSAALVALRIFSALGNLAFLAGLAALAASLMPDARRWAWLGVAVVAFHPAVLDYLVEFRIDGCGYAIAVWSLYLFHSRPRAPRRYLELGLLSGLATLFFSPKLALLTPLVVLFDLLGGGSNPRASLRLLAAYAAGSALAGLVFFLFLAWSRIDLSLISQLLFRYHTISNANSSLQRGLLQSLLKLPYLSALTLASLLAAAVHHLRKRTWPRAYEAAVLVWVAFQVAVVAYPYKQYYAPCFLFASSFPAYLGRNIADLSRRLGVLLVVIASAYTAYHATGIAYAWSRFDEAGRQQRAIRWMNRVTLPEDSVVGLPPIHPIDRRDTFFLWFNTTDPGGFNSERILQQLPSYRQYVTPDRYRRELETHPPALVVLAPEGGLGLYPQAQQAALDAFLTKRGYRSAHVGNTFFAVRHDRHDQARRAGLLE